MDLFLQVDMNNFEINQYFLLHITRTRITEIIRFKQNTQLLIIIHYANNIIRVQYLFIDIPSNSRRINFNHTLSTANVNTISV